MDLLPLIFILNGESQEHWRLIGELERHPEGCSFQVISEAVAALFALLQFKDMSGHKGWFGSRKYIDHPFEPFHAFVTCSELNQRCQMQDLDRLNLEPHLCISGSLNIQSQCAVYDDWARSGNVSHLREKSKSCGWGGSALWSSQAVKFRWKMSHHVWISSGVIALTEALQLLHCHKSQLKPVADHCFFFFGLGC